MAITQAERDDIIAGIDLNSIDDYASNPNSLIEIMTSAEFKQGLECGNFSLEDLNYLFLFGYMATQKALAESKAYTDSKTNQLAQDLSLCNALSPREGNLLRVDPQPGGSCKLYYGTRAEDEILNIYVDSSLGSDSNAGTRVSPMRTIQAALARGSAQVERFIWLKELQAHIVDASNPAVLRGGVLNLNPYGAGIDALPPVVGDYDWSSAAGKALAPTVICPSGVDFGSGFYSANGLLIKDNGVLKASAVNFQPAGKLAGFNESSFTGMISAPAFSTQSAIFSFCNFNFVDIFAKLSDGSSVPMNLSFRSVTTSGAVGFLAKAEPSLIFNQVVPTGATQSDLRPHVSAKSTISGIYTNFNTNMTP
jgi:hypothetical protein